MVNKNLDSRFHGNDKGGYGNDHGGKRNAEAVAFAADSTFPAIARAGSREVWGDWQGRLLANILPQIAPARISFLDQRNFPGTIPLFELFLSGNSRQHVLVLLEIDQHVDLVLFGESRDQLIFVFPDSLDQVAGHADVEGAIALAGEDVDGWLFHWGLPWVDSRLRGNDGRK